MIAASSASLPEAVKKHFCSAPGVMRAEGRVSPEAMEGLRQRGHKLEELPDWWEGSCLYGVIKRNPQTNVLQGGADPRGEAYAVGY